MSDSSQITVADDAVKSVRAPNKIKMVLAIVYILVAVPFIMAWQDVVNSIRDRERHLEMSIDIDPVEFLGSGMIGGLRGVMIDYLWIKVISLEQKHEYYEIRPLIELIQKLQPNLASTWSFNSWNLANNIITDYRSGQDKWRWIKQGIEVIEEGKRKLPGSTEVWFQCGWIYYQIICNPAGDHSIYFQKMVEEQQLAKKKAAEKDGEEFDEPIYAIEIAFNNLKMAAKLKLHHAFSEQHLEGLPFKAAVRGVKYLLLVRQTPDIATGKEFINKAVSEFRFLSAKYPKIDPNNQGLYVTEVKLAEYLNEATELYPEHEEFFSEKMDELSQILTSAPRRLQQL